MPQLQQTTPGTPKPYHQRIPATWWLKHPAYFRFMLREWSSVFVAAYAVVLLVMLNRLSHGPQAYEAFLACLKSWPSIVFHWVAFAFALLHTVTWFQATPQAMAVRFGEKRVPSALIVAANYVAWVAASAFVLWLVVWRA